ncbi:MAG: M20/M25/M40 family metallo-hydrolase, partial [Cyclobacteriaceae bacterium]
VLILFVGILITKSLLLTSRQLLAKQVQLPGIEESSYHRLSHAIQFPTISHIHKSDNDKLVFSDFHQFLESSFPLVFSKLTVERFNDFALLLCWVGDNPALDPVVLTAHMDVVPADPTDSWKYPPFSGHDDGVEIWGRGTLDDKSSLMAIMEALETLLQQGFTPQHTLYIAFGHDEEIDGEYGAATLATILHERGIKAEFVLDEGMVVTHNIVPMMKDPVALIGTSEKGFMNLKITVKADGGHASMPASENVASILAKTLIKINANPLDKKFTKPVDDFLEFLAPEVPPVPRVLFANRWLFDPLLLKVYEGTASGNALVRTTVAPTVIRAGVQDNILPNEATALLNIRILPESSSDDVIKYYGDLIDDPRINVDLVGFPREPAPVSPVDVPAFELIHQVVKDCFPKAIVCPTLMLGASDSRHYSLISDNIYRFAPYELYPETINTIHGVNERITRNNYDKCIAFYYLLMQKC